MAIAEKTDVPFERSIADVIGLLKRAGADNIAQVDGRSIFRLQFELAERTIRFSLPYLSDEQIAERTGPRQATANVAAQWQRQRGRALLLVVRAKLESVETGIESVEEAFLANVVMPKTGATVYEETRGYLALNYRGGPPIPLLGAPDAKRHPDT